MGTGAAPSARDYAAYGALALLLAAACTFQYRDSRDRLDQASRADLIRIPFEGGIISNRIDGVEPEAQAVGIVRGHYLVTINGQPLRGAGEIFRLLRTAKAGDVVTLGTRSTPRGPVEHEARVTLVADPLSVRGVRDWLLTLTSTFGVPTACIAFGFFVASVRVRDPQAWIVLMLLLGVSRLGGTSTALWGHGDALEPFAIVYLAAAEMALPVGMTLFGIYFGERLGFDRRHPWAKWLLLVTLLALSIGYVRLMILAADNWPAAGALAPWIFSPLFACYFGSAVVFFAGIGVKAFREKATPEFRGA
jgi:hypothetical protein